MWYRITSFILMAANQMPQSLLDKIWESHCVRTDNKGSSLLYVDRHIVHEVTSAQAFEGLRVAGRQVWRNESVLAMPDHQVPTQNRASGLSGIVDRIAKLQVTTLDSNCKEFGIKQFSISDLRQGIVHVAGPEQGATLPGMTVVCGDSHTSTHGAFAALAIGIGTSEVEHVLATQCLIQKKPLSMLINVNGELPSGTTAKDLILYIVGQIGMAGANGHVIEYAGNVINRLSMEERMTVCNMSIEMGARAGMVAFDQTTESYLLGRPFSPKAGDWQDAVLQWGELTSDDNACYDQRVQIDASEITPQITWGTKPEQVVPISGSVPDPNQIEDEVRQQEYLQALDYMELTPGTPMIGIAIDRVFVGSCTNGRIEDIRAVAKTLQGRHIADNIKEAIVVPGSGLVKQQAEQEGLHEVIMDAGFEWRDPGCSMCNAMNPDQLLPGERCASTSNRNFEGRQGRQGRTHLLSPVMAAAASIAGCLVDARTFAADLGDE